MADPKIRLSKTQADDIYAVCSLGTELLSKVADAVEALPPTIRKEKVQTSISEIAGPDEGKLIRRVVFALATVYRRDFDDAPKLLDSLLIPQDWEERQRSAWHECRAPIERLLSAPAVVLSAKAADLSFDVERFCVGARIITDVRPIFGTGRTEIVGTTIRQTMRLEYMTNDGTVTSLSIGLDAADIARIRRICDEAVRKAEVASATMRSAGLTEVLIPGEEEDND